MKITWTKDHPRAQYSSHSGIDEQGNRYWENACREVVQCQTPDGRTGQGWTAGEALRNALSEPQPSNPPRSADDSQIADLH